jgi:REP element-mobilizing transposase RayT
MPRANRHFLPGYVWHITHRCHRKSFLLRFSRDRRSYLRWVFEAKKRFGLSVLDYIVTCNHVHLLVKDTGPNVIANSIQLIASRTGQEYNQRKGRHGAFWEDRYHATAIEADKHLHRCLVYIDLNMVRAGVVSHPSNWVESGYREIQNPPKRYRIIDLAELSSLCGLSDVSDFQRAHREWIKEALSRNKVVREANWSEAIAVGSLGFANNVKTELGLKAVHREVAQLEERMHFVSKAKLTKAISAAKLRR